jgi:hypothetical protein
LRNPLKSKKQAVNACFFSAYIILKNNTVASVELHSNQMWKDLRDFYSLVGVFEKLLKIKKAGH